MKPTHQHKLNEKLKMDTVLLTLFRWKSNTKNRGAKSPPISINVLFKQI
jgi:hypothetical protein